MSDLRDVLEGLLTHAYQDALDLRGPAEKALRQKKAANQPEGPMAFLLAAQEPPVSVDYDSVLKELKALVAANKAETQIGSLGLPEFRRKTGARG